MNLHEKNLKEIIKAIEKYGSVRDVRILNNSIYICHPSPTKKSKPALVSELDLNRPKEFEIKFILGDEKKQL